MDRLARIVQEGAWPDVQGDQSQRRGKKGRAGTGGICSSSVTVMRPILEELVISGRRALLRAISWERAGAFGAPDDFFSHLLASEPLRQYCNTL